MNSNVLDRISMNISHKDIQYDHVEANSCQLSNYPLASTLTYECHTWLAHTFLRMLAKVIAVIHWRFGQPLNWWFPWRINCFPWRKGHSTRSFALRWDFGDVYKQLQYHAPPFRAAWGNNRGEMWTDHNGSTVCRLYVCMYDMWYIAIYFNYGSCHYDCYCIYNIYNKYDIYIYCHLDTQWIDSILEP